MDELRTSKSRRPRVLDRPEIPLIGIIHELPRDVHPRRNQRHPHAHADRHDRNEPIPPIQPLPQTQNVNPRHHHPGEQERRHPPENTIRYRQNDRRELPHHTQKKQPRAAPVPRVPGGAPGEREDAVVLGVGGDRGDGAQGAEEGVEAVGEDRALDALLELGADWFQVGGFGGCGDVADAFHGCYHEGEDHGQDGGGVEAEWEALRPQEGYPLGLGDLSACHVPA